MVRRVTAWKMGMGAVLAATVLGVVGGLMYLNFLVTQAQLRDAAGAVDSGLPVLIVDAGGVEWYNESLPPGRFSAVNALNVPQEMEGMAVTLLDTPDGPVVREINGKGERAADGLSWRYWVLREGNWTYGGRVGGHGFALQRGDVLLWQFGKAPEDPGAQPAGYEGLTAVSPASRSSRT